MANYDITLKGTSDQAGPTENVVADAYQQEGPMTTFFRLDGNRTVIDCWSTRVASFRTADLLAVRRRDGSVIDVGHEQRAPARRPRGDRLCPV